MGTTQRHANAGHLFYQQKWNWFSNKDLPLLPIQPMGAAYLTRMLPHNLRLQLEAYHSPSNVPVSNNPNDIFWALNTFRRIYLKTLHSRWPGPQLQHWCGHEKTFQSDRFHPQWLGLQLYISKPKRVAKFIIPTTTADMPGIFRWKNWQLNRATSLKWASERSTTPACLLHPCWQELKPQMANGRFKEQFPSFLSIEYLIICAQGSPAAIHKNKTGSSWWLALDIQNVINHKNGTTSSMNLKMIATAGPTDIKVPSPPSFLPTGFLIIRFY